VDINPHFARGSWEKKDEKEVYAIFWNKHSATVIDFLGVSQTETVFVLSCKEIISDAEEK